VSVSQSRSERQKILSNKLIQKAFANIDTVHGRCEECGEDSILVAIVSEFYRCTNCGADTRQHVNGSIRYIKLTESDKAYIKANGQENI
jgi:DNA-directed RNA polymerase subunit RPC12/RpoP